MIIVFLTSVFFKPFLTVTGKLHYRFTDTAEN